jgi:hypothetical protein
MEEKAYSYLDVQMEDVDNIGGSRLNMPHFSAKRVSKRKHLRYRTASCHCCKIEVPFCWTCRCGFKMCQNCMNENIWGMSCNGITWQCPDCGEWNGFGNQ